MTYCEIETFLGINGNSIHSILHEYLKVKKFVPRWKPTQFVNRSKKSINQSDKSALSIGSNAGKSL